MISVVIADDQPLLRGGVRMVLDSEPDIVVVGEAADGHAALAMLRRHAPTVLLLDVRMPGLDGLAVLRQVAADPGLAGVRVVVLTTFDLDEYLYEALRLGAAGFLLKDADPAELLRAVRVAAEGEAVLAPSATRRLVETFVASAVDGPSAAASPEAANLTPREQEVVSLVAQGLTNEEIAARLVLSPATVRTHVGRAMSKVAARDRAQLVVFAYQSGLVRSST
ncbi:response regulator transcription factor [Natronosporangium hydrolyticum]|uniref:Response regulator transcription factor n=1 Tax=Natronosporangium hydrolyticum TaxID=2811111 RepID=A0A895YFR5_9ACTN|nr:response regulator transcription factor [Natronosporangium hydrolyticum]QSB13030.1 response regulator transcription factor [Natronosporangium hydrolyticum]